MAFIGNPDNLTRALSGSDYWWEVELSGNSGVFNTFGQRVSTAYKLANAEVDRTTGVA